MPFVHPWTLSVALALLAWALPFQALSANIVVDAQTGVVLASNEPTLRWPPASLTKLMTLYLTFAAIEDGSLKLDQVLDVSAHAAGQLGSRLGLAAGDKITAQDAILAVVTQSGNDAAMVLAEAVSGSEATFVDAMNVEAQALGLEQSYFVNPTGLPDSRQSTSARDMALLAKALWTDYPMHYHFFGARSMQFAHRDLPTVNGFLVSYQGADGLKTGTTCDAGHNLVASASRDGFHLIGVVLGADDNGARIAGMSKLLNDGFDAAVNESGIDIVALRSSSSEPRRSWMGAGSCLTGTPLSPAPTSPPALPGWGLVLGAYAQDFRAQRQAELVRDSLGLPRGIGQPKFIPLQNGKYYAALLVGLNEDRATAACQRLRQSGSRCVKLNPSELNDPAASWRN